jgi:hypothetical protein
MFATGLDRSMYHRYTIVTILLLLSVIRQSNIIAYKRFVDHHGGWPPPVQHAYGVLSDGRNLSDEEIAGINKAHASFAPPQLPAGMHCIHADSLHCINIDINEVYVKIGVVAPRASPYASIATYMFPTHWSRRRQLCHLIHPHNTSCILGWMRTWRESFGRALPVYIPVYLIPLVLLRWRRLMKHPLPSLTHTATGVMRSSAFLATYCSGNFLVQCFLRNFVYGEETSK